MKNILPLYVFVMIVISLFLSSCAKDYLTMSIAMPAPVSISPDAKRAGVINRTSPSKENEKLDKIDKILSIEGINLDEEGAQNAVLGLFEELENNDRFTQVKLLDSMQVSNPGIGIFPAPLSWEAVGQICRENDVDVLFSLSFYDTDGNISYQAIPVEIKTPINISIPAIEHHATISTHIKTGWRIYDPANKLILDEIAFNEVQVSTGKGINPVKAAEALIGRKEGVMQISHHLGQEYALRIVPYSVRARREYFAKGNKNFKIAKRRAQTGNWDGAAELWKKEVNNSKRKIAGRACYNMAVINEINGNLEAASDWAAKSYTDYKIKPALDYLNLLKARIADNEQLHQQID